VLTSKDANLTKAHARYLESRFITLARQARRSRLINGTAPAPLPLPEADISDMEYFITQAKIVLPVLGVNILRSAATADDGTAGAASGLARASSPVFSLHVKKDGISAQAREIDGEFTVLEGSSPGPPGLEPSTPTGRYTRNWPRGRPRPGARWHDDALCSRPGCSRARAPPQPSSRDVRRMGVLNGRSRLRAPDIAQ